MKLNQFIGNTIKTLRESRNMTQEDLAERLSVTRQTISRYENGDRKTDQDVLFCLSEIFQVSINDFFPHTNNSQLNTERQHTTINKYLKIKSQDKVDDYVDMVFASEGHDDSKNVIDFSKHKEGFGLSGEINEAPVSYTTVPTIDLRPSAGTGTSHGDIEIGQNTFSNVPKKHYDYSIQVKGDSMEPKIKNDEWIFIRRQSAIEHGEIGLFDLNNESFVKKFMINDKGIYELHSLNPIYSPITIKEDDYFRCEGLVIFK